MAVWSPGHTSLSKHVPAASPVWLTGYSWHHPNTCSWKKGLSPFLLASWVHHSPETWLNNWFQTLFMNAKGKVPKVAKLIDETLHWFRCKKIPNHCWNSFVRQPHMQMEFSPVTGYLWISNLSSFRLIYVTNVPVVLGLSMMLWPGYSFVSTRQYW